MVVAWAFRVQGEIFLTISVGGGERPVVIMFLFLLKQHFTHLLPFTSYNNTVYAIIPYLQKNPSAIFISLSGVPLH